MPVPASNQDRPIVNCHTHVFIGESVPPFFGKTYLPLGLHRVLSIPFILSVCRFWYLDRRSPRQWHHQYWYKNLQLNTYLVKSFLARGRFVRGVISLASIYLTLHATLYFALWLISVYKGADTSTADVVIQVRGKLADWRVLWLPAQDWARILVILFTFVFIRNGRRLLFFAGTKIIGIAGMIPDKKTMKFLGRYLNIGRFAYYKSSKDIYNKLVQQYDAGTGFILLPMDMEFMDAGRPKGNGLFGNQMKELAAIKRTHPKTAFPFVFVDPRRESVDDLSFFLWNHHEGRVSLKDCFIKQYVEERKFNGFKIYPALGYYPFDERLLPLWKYAADRRIPIMAHCIRGTVFYRGEKKREWGRHPVFHQSAPDGKHEKMLLPELRNEDFCNNFGHPLNYLCLLEERLLRQVVKNASREIKDLFGFKNESEPMERDLRHLKLCFGHYGGDDEWREYFEKDRDRYNSQLKTKPGKGISFFSPGDISSSYNRLEQIWNSASWYSIISSIMLQYDNMYADISYIIHDNGIVPLLKQTLQHPKLSTRVLFGTDFYVVRNHKSEKQMLSELITNLGVKDFDKIARLNPRSYLDDEIPEREHG